jgi:sporulation protein YlmC with PRC-barrel domain
MGQIPECMDLVYRVLDEQLVDVDGRRCGRADDLELDGGVGAPPRLYAIVSGAGAWHRRLPRPLRSLGARIFGTEVWGRNAVRVPWDQVDEISSVIKLKAKARELGLGQGDDKLRDLVARMPAS